MSVGFIAEAVREEMVPVTISFQSGVKDVMKFGYSNAVALFANHELFSAGIVCLPRYYPSGVRLHLIDHAKIERLEVAVSDHEKFIQAVREYQANED
ncbi:MAG: hypothetical protein NXH70_02435 [Hyphomonas sp.]|nr:hypothetical protein [Hyphomonas sp.]